MSVLQIQTAPVFVPFLKPSRYKACHGGRGGGKSWFFAELLVEEHIRAKSDSVCIREIQKSLQFSSKKLIEQTISKMNAGDYFEVQDKVIKVKNGGIIIFQGMQDHTADSIKSLEGFDRAWFEEAQNASQRSLDLLRPTIRKKDSELWFTWNRFKEDDPIELLLCGEHMPNDAIIVECNIDDNPWVTAELLQEREDDRNLYDSDKFANIWQGKYLKNTEGDYYKREMQSVRDDGRLLTIPRLDIAVNTFWDIGNSDGCAVWFHQKVGMEHRFIGYYEAHGETLAHYARELQTRGYVYGKHFMPHDASQKKLSDTNKSVMEMMQDLGLNNIEIVPVISKLDTGIQITKKHFPSAYFDKEQCKVGIKMLDNYRKRYSQRDNRWIDEPDKRNGASEAADALRQWAQAIELDMLSTSSGVSSMGFREAPYWRG